MFKRAGQPELVRSNQKDVYYVTFLRESVGQIFRDFAGVYSWIKWKDELELLAELSYFGLTTLSGFQTLGEEYCNIVQVDHTKQAIPSTLSLFSLVLLQAVAPYALRKLLAKLTILVQTPDRWPTGMTEKSRLILLEYLPIIQQSILFVHRTHLTLFYLTGIFYHISKRLTSIHYILVRSGFKDISTRPTYQLLGYISTLQLTLTLIFSVYKKSSSSQISKPVNPTSTYESISTETSSKENQTSMASTHKKLKCSLCLEPLHSITATPCGHLFDWYCITEWCSNKQECPLCRDPVSLSRLVCLHHFDYT